MNSYLRCSPHWLVYTQMIEYSCSSLILKVVLVLHLLLMLMLLVLLLLHWVWIRIWICIMYSVCVYRYVYGSIHLICISSCCSWNFWGDTVGPTFVSVQYAIFCRDKFFFSSVHLPFDTEDCLESFAYSSQIILHMYILSKLLWISKTVFTEYYILLFRIHCLHVWTFEFVSLTIKYSKGMYEEWFTNLHSTTMNIEQESKNLRLFGMYTRNLQCRMEINLWKVDIIHLF